MMIRIAAILAVSAILFLHQLGAVELAAQQRDAFVAPRGMVRLEVGGIFTGFDERFAADGGKEALAADLEIPLDAEGFAPIGTLNSNLLGFFEATADLPGAEPIDVQPGALTAGSPDILAAGTRRIVPLRLGVGVLPRVEVFAETAVLRADVTLQRFALDGASVGLNPNATQNQAAVENVAAEWGALGSAPFLPLAGSALGDELERRVPGISLPSDPLVAAELNAFLAETGSSEFTSRNEDWRLGDVQVGARVQLLGGTGDRFYPASPDGVHLRSTASASVRLATGTEHDPRPLIQVSPEAGLSGFSAGLDTDVFAGRWLWATGSVHYSNLGEVEVIRRVTDSDRPLAPLHAVRWDPADLIEIDIHPRVRFAGMMAAGINYRAILVSESTYSVATEGAADPSVLNTASGTIQQLGATLRYSTFPARSAGSTVLPLDVQLSYRTTLSGVDRSAAGSSVILQASLYWQAF